MLSKQRPQHPELVRLQGCCTRPELAGMGGPALHSFGGRDPRPGLPFPRGPPSPGPAGIRGKAHQGRPARSQSGAPGSTAVAATSSAESNADRRAPAHGGRNTA